MQLKTEHDRSPAGGAAGSQELRFRPAGDTALDVIVGQSMELALSGRVLSLARRIEAARIPGVVEVVPAFAALTVHFDPLAVGFDALVARVEELGRAPGAEAGGGRKWCVPVCYEGAAAPDIDDVAAKAELTRAEVIARHCAGHYHVYMLGFLPGFPYMGDLDTALRLPRRESPRLAVPPGSVAIANAMTAIYPLESPGGWHLIGRTPVRLFDPARSLPSLFAPGDAVRFKAVDAAEFERLEAAAARGAWLLEPDPDLNGGLPA